MRYVFGDYILDPQRQELWRAGTRLVLRPKVFQLLLYLLEQRDRLVSKHELIEQLWPHQFISEATLLSCIKAVRQAVGDAGRTQLVIETRHRQGYRFVAAVALEDTSVPMPERSSDSVPSAPFAPLSSALASPVVDDLAGEHKLVTVLSCALIEATALVTRLDSEALHDLMQAWFARAQEIVQQYEGMVIHRLEGGFTALFGAPRAQEDHAQRAVRAALALQQHLQTAPELRALASGGNLAMRLGLHTGPIVIGYLGEEASQMYTALGPTTTRATAIQQGAGVGEVLLSDTTYRLVQREVQLAIPASYASGEGPLYAIRGLTSPTDGVRHGQSPRSPFVGRQRELAILQERLAYTASGQGQVVKLVGEPGIGKSRLLYEFRQTLTGQAVTYRTGHCQPYGSAMPYLPLQALLRQACGLTETDTVDTVTARIAQRLREVGLDAEEDGPFLLHVLDVPSAAAAFTRLSPQARKTRAFTLLHHLHRCDSQQQPLILAVENVHWIDATSAEYLTTLATQLAGVALMLVVTCRPGSHSPWLDQAVVTQLALPRLLPQDSVQVVQSVAPTSTLPESVVTTILTKAAGNPLFLEELTWAYSTQEAATMALPDTIQAVLAARMDHLALADKRLLQIAAVLGGDIPVPLLQTITGMPAEELQQRLQTLQHLDFLQLMQLLPETVYTFKHVLTQEVAYQSMLTRTRQQVHERIAEVLLRQFPDMVATQPAVLAQHYTAAGRGALALPYWQRAGQHALEHSAYVEAIAHLTQGLELLQTLPETPERAEHELRLLTTLAPAFVTTRSEGAAEVEQTYSRAYVLGQQVGDTTQRCQVLRGLSRMYLMQANLRQARALGEELLSLAGESQDAGLLLQAHSHVGSVLYWCGAFVEARTHLEQAVALYDPLQHHALTRLTAYDPGVMAHAEAMHVLWCLGYPDQSLHHIQEALRLAQELAHPYSLVWSLMYRAHIHMRRRDIQETEAWAAQGLALARAQGFAHRVASFLLIQGWAWAHQGRGAEGLAQLGQGWAAYQAVGAQLAQTQIPGMMAEAYGQVGQPDEGLRLLHEALTSMQGSDERYFEAELYRIQGELLLQLPSPRPDAAAACFHQAIAVARQQQAKALELRATLHLARLWAQQGQRAAARTRLAEIYGWFTEGFATPDLQEARALLESLEPDAPR